MDSNRKPGIMIYMGILHTLFSFDVLFFILMNILTLSNHCIVFVTLTLADYLASSFNNRKVFKKNLQFFLTGV